MSSKFNRSILTKLAIKEYEKKIVPIRENRDYAQEAATHMYTKSIQNNINRRNAFEKRNTFLSETKKWLLEETIYKIFNESLGSILSEQEFGYISDDMKHAIVFNFIEEAGGVNKLLDRFSYKNAFLSEIASFVNYYNDKIVNETCKDEDDCDDDDFDKHHHKHHHDDDEEHEHHHKKKHHHKDHCHGGDCEDGYKIPSDIQDDFFEELDNADFGDATIQISNRVVDAMDQFVSDNAEAMNNIKEILATTKDKVAASKNDAVAESVQRVAKSKISDIKYGRKMNVFGVMMEETAKSIMKDEELRKTFLENATLDVARLQAYCAVSYTMLETANTCKMIDVDADYIKNVIDTL